MTIDYAINDWNGDAYDDESVVRFHENITSSMMIIVKLGINNKVDIDLDIVVTGSNIYWR
jgi:hypothetical protein